MGAPENPARTLELPEGQTLRRRLGRVFLHVLDGPDAGKELKVEGTRVTGGRSAVNDLPLAAPSVSGTHFELRLTDEGVELRDLGSTNGTWIRGMRVQRVWIEPGTTFVAGRCAIKLVSADEVDVPILDGEAFESMVGVSAAMREVFARLDRVARERVDVLLHGETGTGKELAARAIHARSPRAEGPFVVLDCGSLPRELAEGTILGYRKGAFTGAHADASGCFEDAHAGTLFLDEIGELPLDLQPKLLRVLDRREVQRIGETKVRSVDVRVVAATHRDVRHMVGEGTFREDLYFRVAEVSVDLPPLRERKEDVEVIARAFVQRFGEGREDAPVLGEGALEALRAHAWPGNVRELSKAIKRAVLFAEGAQISAADLGLGATAGRARRSELDGLLALPLPEARDAFEVLYLRALMEDTGGNISAAARRVGFTRKGLRELLQRRGVYRRD